MFEITLGWGYRASFSGVSSDLEILGPQGDVAADTADLAGLLVEAIRGDRR